jgi:GNAT superfamily N-acetyltransferase
MDELVVRPADLADEAELAALARLRWEWRVGAGEEPEVDEPAFAAVFAAWLRDHVGSHRAHVAVVHGEIVGMAWLAVVERVPGPSSWPRLSGYVQSTYVTPAHRNAGIGAQIIQAVIADAQANGLDYLAVHPSEPSMDFYARLGFAPYARSLELRFGR